MAQVAMKTLLWRALRGLCPVCGAGKIFRTHFHRNRTCPGCQVVFWKDPGESVGAMYVDYAIATVSFLLSWAVLAFFTHLSELWQLVVMGTVAGSSVPLFYPLSRSIWTMMVYLSGGIETAPIRALPGGKKS